MNTIFKIEKLEKLDELVDTINNLTINDAGSELYTATVSGAQVNLMSNPDTFTHTRNIILDQELLSFPTNEEVSVLSLPKNPRIALTELTPQTLLVPAVQEIFVDTDLGNTWTNRIPQKSAGLSLTYPSQFTLQFIVG